MESESIPKSVLAPLDENEAATPSPVLAGQSNNSTILPDRKQPALPANMFTIGLALVFFYQVFLLILAGWQNRHVLTPDGVSYIRIATYYLHGQFDLAISGYWGPMLSWLIAPALALVENPLYAARIAMGISAIVFLIGCVSIFRSLEIHPAGLLTGAWVAAVSGAAWSVETINSHLLMSGLMCIAISRMITPRWLETRSAPIAAGVFWGIVYLAKAVAFPLAFIISGAIASLWLIGRWSDRKFIGRSLAMTLMAFLALACVWILILSLKYEKFVITTNAAINYANVGPENTTRLHPSFSVFHTPEARRVTSWEDPTTMPYQSWSPLNSIEDAKHQWLLISWNAGLAFKYLSGFATPQFGLFAMIFGFLVHTPWRQNLLTERWRWAGVIVLCIVGIYLSVYGEEQRHYYAVYPFLFAASIGMVTWLTREFRGKIAWPRIIGLAVIAVCFAVPAYAALKLASVQTTEKKQAVHARDLAKKLKAAGLQGSIAGGGEGGLYVAFFTEQAWHGDESNPTAGRLNAAQAKLIVLPSYQRLNDELDRNAAFANLDTLLFGNKEDAEKSPWKVYQVIRPQQ